MTLDVSSLANAVQRLREGVARHAREPDDEQLRDGLIQRFEFTYDLSHKMLRRYLQERSASADETAQLSFADMIRTANAQELLKGDWAAWRRYREMRTRTSHTYDAAIASEIAAAIPDFLEEAEFLLVAPRRGLP